MVWRHVLFPKPSIYPYEFEALKAIGSFSSSILCLTGNSRKFYGTKKPSSRPGEGFKKVGLSITPQIVHSTLASCSSDLVALSFFMWCARQPNYFHDHLAFGHMVNVAARLTQKFISVKEIVKQLEIVGCVTKPQTFLFLLRIFWQGKLYSLVFDVYEEMIRFGYSANTFVYNVIIDVSFKIGRVDIALGVLRGIKVPNFFSYKVAVLNFCKLNNLEDMKDVMRSMLKAGYYPDAKIFVMVVNCLCKNVRIDEAFQVLGMMISLGTPVPIAFWSILIDGLCRIGRPTDATIIMHKMIGMGCFPNVVTYTSLVKAFMDYEMVDDAFKILTMMENSGCKADLILYNMLIHRLSKIGRYDVALRIFFDLRKNSIEPDSYTCCSLLSAVQRSGKFHLLSKLVKGLAFPADLILYNSFISFLCKVGLPNHAVEFYHEMVHQGYIPDKYSYAGLLSGLCRARRIDEAVNVYKGMLMSHFDIDAHVHTVIIGGLIKIRKNNQAISLFKRVVNEMYDLDVVLCSTAIEGFVKGGRVEEALTLHNQMRDSGICPNARAYNLMLVGLCTERDFDMVKVILQQMHDKRIKLESSNCVRVTNSALKSRYYSSVFDLLVKMWDCGLIADSVMHVLLAEAYSKGIIIGDIPSYLRGDMEDKSSIRTSRSDRYSYVKTSCSVDLSDMVASAG